MADDFKAASLAAGLSPEEQKKVDAFNKALAVHRNLQTYLQTLLTKSIRLIPQRSKLTCKRILETKTQRSSKSMVGLVLLSIIHLAYQHKLLDTQVVTYLQV